MSNSYEDLIINSAINKFISGEKNKGILELENFLLKNKNNLNAIYNIALMSQQIGQIDKSIRYYSKVIKSDTKHWESRINLCLIYIEKNLNQSALKLVNEVLIIKKNYQPALREKALILYNLNELERGLSYIEKSINLNSNDYIAINTQGLILMALGKYEDAKIVFINAINISKKYAPTYNNLGRCLNYLNDTQGAKKLFIKTLELDPTSYHAINNLGGYYLEQGKYLNAIKYYEKADLIKPNDSFIINNIAKAYFNLKYYDKAEQYYNKAIKIDPNNPEIKSSYVFLLLQRHNYSLAWKYNESRYEKNDFNIKNINAKIIKPFLWSGKNITKESKILVIKEQGVGDEIIYSSMYNDLLNEYTNVKIECDKRLINLFKNSFNKSNVFYEINTFSEDKEKLKNFDFVMYAATLGKLFRNSLDSFKISSWIKTDIEKYNYYKKFYKSLSKKPKIGISWRSFRQTYGDHKSIDLFKLKSLLELNNFTFINLQYGNSENEIKEFMFDNKSELINIEGLDLTNDFDSLAPVIKNLDLMISVSNSTAHLSASLGVETWVLKPWKSHAAFHYWNQSKNITPWYKSVSLYETENENFLNILKQDLLKKFS